METNQIYNLVLVLIMSGLIIGVGVMTFDKLGSSVYETRTANDTIAGPLTNKTLVTLDFGNITSVNYVRNSSSDSDVPSTCYTINTTHGQFRYDNISTACYLDASGVTLSYDYKQYNTPTSRATSSIVTEISGIATNWLGLIVTISVLGLILFMVISGFGGFGNFGKGRS